MSLLGGVDRSRNGRPTHVCFNKTSCLFILKCIHLKKWQQLKSLHAVLRYRFLEGWVQTLQRLWLWSNTIHCFSKCTTRGTQTISGNAQIDDAFHFYNKCILKYVQKIKPTQDLVGFPHSSVGKESACNSGDQGSIPGSGRSSGEGNGLPSMGSHRVGHDWSDLAAAAATQYSYILATRGQSFSLMRIFVGCVLC